MIQQHTRAYETFEQEPHFDADMRFRQYETDPVSGKSYLTPSIEISMNIGDMWHVGTQASQY